MYKTFTICKININKIYWTQKVENIYKSNCLFIVTLTAKNSHSENILVKEY